MKKELFINIEKLEIRNKSDFENIFTKCNDELGIPLDSIIPDFIYQAGTNDGIIAYDIYQNYQSI